MKPGDSFQVGEYSCEVHLLEVLRPLLAHKRFHVGATEFLSRLTQSLGCSRASLGLVIGEAITLCAVSHICQKITPALLPEVKAAMEESLLQDAALAYPHLPGDFPYIGVAHDKLVHAYGLSSALTIPLGENGRLIGAITLEKHDQPAFGVDQLAFVERLAQDAAPLLRLKYFLEQPLAVRCMHSLRLGLKQDRQTWLRAKLAAGIFLLVTAIGLFTIPFSSSVSGQAHLEASVQRIISAPIDGYLKEVRVRPGDSVKAQQVLAELNDETLLTEGRKLEAEALQQENAVAEAMAKADRTQIVLRRAKLDEVLAQRDLVAQQLERIQLVAPFDGVVIKGDLSQLLGSPLRRGDVLLTLSQGPEFRVIVEVPERDVSDIRLGQRGTLFLTALPAKRFAFHVVRINPVAAVSSDGQNVFEVEARLDATPPNLVPGLKGIAKIAGDDKPIGWKWAARAWHAVSFLAWSRSG